MVSPEEHALTRTYAILVESLEHCAVDVTGLLFAKEMIPKSLRRKVSNNSSAVGDVIDCLIGRIKINHEEFVDVVEILMQCPTLATAVKKLKEQYAECGGTLALPKPEAKPLPLPPEAKPDPAIVKTEAAKDEAGPAKTEPVKMEPAIITEVVPEKPDNPPATNTSNRMPPPATSDHTPSPSATSDQSPSPPEKHEFSYFSVWLAVGVVAIAMACYFVPPLLFHLLHNQEPKPQQAILDCHELRESDVLELEGYLNVDVSLEKLCFSLSLENCYVLKSGGELDHYKLAKSYLVQKPGACWEDIVSVLCRLKQNLQAVEVCKKHNVNFTNTKPCSLKPGVD